MPRHSQSLKTKIETRLSSGDLKNLICLAQSKNLTKSEMARQAIRWYLKYHETIENQKKESELTQSIRQMTERICGMLARQGAQVGTLFELAWQSHLENQIEQRFVSAANTVKQNMRKRLTEDERVLANKMKEVVQ
jgi:hypothetical protein